MKTRLFILFVLLGLGLCDAAARTIVGVNGNSPQQIFTFDSATPGTLSSPVTITGLVSGDQIEAIDFRPANGVLYALGINSGTSPDTGRIYTINVTTGVATQIGTNFSTNLTDSSGTASYGFDFNPTADRIRVTNGYRQNLRVNPDVGVLAGTDTALSSGSIVGLAYDRNDRNPNTSTTLFGIDYSTDELVRIGGVNGSPSPNGGVVTTIGPTGVSTSPSNISFDIAEDGVAFASMPVGGFYRFYTINLSTGAATLVGNIGAGTVVIRGIAAVPSPVANIDSGQFFSTIQSAINAIGTVNGHTIVVNAGTYNELVTVNKQLTILGAKSGFDATTGVFRGTNESVVRGNATHSSAFNIAANNVTIDGFTIQDTSDPNNFGAGIFMGPNHSGTNIRNNIFRNNIVGIQVSNNLEYRPLIIERNLFANNNQPGPISGTGIYTDQFKAGSTFTNAVIDSNSFQGNGNAAVLLGSTLAGSQKNIAITNNTMDNNGNAVLIFNTASAFITGNTITHSAASQVAVGGGIDGLDISENFISAGSTRGIRVGDFGGGSTNSNVVVGCNSISGNATAGLEINTGSTPQYTGTLLAAHNYWGAITGPTIASNAGGTGDKIIDAGGQVSFRPFRSEGVDQQPAAAGFQCYPVPTLYGINSTNNNLIRFKGDTPVDFVAIPITGLAGGETILGIDFRPATGELFGLSSGSRLYVIDPITGAATQRGSSGAFTLNGTAFGFDFNPTSDRIRVISDTGQNLRLNPNNGTLSGADTPLAYASGDPNFGVSGDAGGAAYTNNYAGATRTTLYDIDTVTDTLAHQGSIFGLPTSPNSGQLFTTGGLGVNADDATHFNTAFDIYSPVPGVNRGFAALSITGALPQLLQVNLISGQTSNGFPIGLLNPGPTAVRGLAAAPTGVIAFSAGSYLVAENAGVATITINRVGGSEGTVNVMFTTSDVEATAGSDYTNADQMVTFGPGETTKTVQVPITNDDIDEFSESIFLQLQEQPGGGFLAAPFTAVLTITDDDVSTPTLTAQSSSTAAVGEPISDVATISSPSFLGGMLTFRLFGPNDNTCGDAPIFTSTVQVNGNGDYTSETFTPTTPGTYRWVVSYSGDADHNAVVATACDTANQAFDATATVLGNIATRLRVETGDNILIAGFIITGTQPKKVIVRGIGTSLPLDDKLQDPTLELRDSTGALIEANDNWVDSPNKQPIIDSTIPPTSDLESAIVATLPANNSGYTAILRGVNDGTGIGVVEAYDLDRLVDSQLANISTRGFVSTGDNVLIAGTIVVGKNPRNVIVRAIGPSLSIPGKMEDPTLELRDGNGDLIEANDNWVDSPNKQAIIDSTIPPTNDKESAIVATLPANNAGYTAIVRGVNNTTGIAVVEVYALP